MAEFDAQKQIIQKAIADVVVHGNLTVGDITQIVNLPQPERFIPDDIPANLPTSNTIKFVGREKKLRELHDLLSSPQAVMVTGLAGMGGVGKTELATQYAWLYYLTEAYPGGICWVRARNEEISLQITGFAREKFGLNIPEDITDPVARVKYCWGRWLAGNVLVVFDDVADYQGIVPYLPQEPRFKVLVTTRLDLDLPKLNLDVLDEDEALQLLGEWIGADKLAAQAEDGKELALRLGYLPLALNLVGRYVRKRKISLAEMLNRLAEKGLEHPALDVDRTDKTWTLQIGRGVKAAFELSWVELSEDAQTLGMLLSVFALAPILWELVAAVELGWETERLEDARIEMESLHLLQEQQESYRLHQLIREFLQGKLAAGQQPIDLKRAFVAAMIAKCRKIEFILTLDQISALEIVMPHITEVAENYTDLLRDEDQEISWIFTTLAIFYEGQALYQQAEIWREKCLKITEKRLGSDHPDTATSLNNLAELYHSQGRYSEAEPLFRRSISIDEKVHGADHPDTATSLNNLAELYKSQGRYSEAEPLFRRSLSIIEKQLGADHPSTATSLNNLAGLYKSQGKYGEAEPLYRRSLEIMEKHLGADHPSTAMSYGNLAGVYEFQGKYQEALPLRQKALAIHEQQLGLHHPHTATSLNNLAALYQSQGRYSEAEPLFRRSLSIDEKVYGADHPSTAIRYGNLALSYKSQGKKEQALEFYQQALSILEVRLGADHPTTVITRNNFNVLRNQANQLEGTPDPQPMILKILSLPFRLLRQSLRWFLRRLRRR